VGGRSRGPSRAPTTAQALPRVTIEAYDRDNLLVAATATGDDGSFELPSLLPARYSLRFRAEGYVDQWWPGTSSISTALPVLAPPGGVTDGIDVVLVGQQAVLGGQVVAGDVEGLEVAVTVEAIDLLVPVPAFTTVTGPDGTWSVEGLPSPATYRITYRAPGFDAVEITQPLAGGALLAVNTATLPAAPGLVSGTVVDRQGRALGGVDVQLTRGELTIATKTPTSGEVGFFEIPELRTPGTYLMTFVLDGFASETIAVRLGPGEQRDDLVVVLAPAFGSIVGVVRGGGDDGLAGLGGVRILVSGGGVLIETETLTAPASAVGTFTIPDLPLPGTYTLTFDAPGFARQTIQASVSRATPTVSVTTNLGIDVGRVEGRISGPSAPGGLRDVIVVLTDGGAFRRETITASAPDALVGTYAFDGLPPGTYSIIATRPSGSPRTIVGEITVSVVPGQSSVFTVDLVFPESS